LRPYLILEPVRGNIDTRLRKHSEGQYDAIVLALAGLKRTELFTPGTMQPIAPEQLLPAPGQGALALQCRRDDERTRKLLQLLDDAPTASCVEAERKIVKLLEGDCHSPIAALATIESGQITLQAAVGARDGNPPVITAAAQGSRQDADSAVAAVYQSLLAQDAPHLLSGRR
jgi:hydroxymethylbilane synthase